MSTNRELEQNLIEMAKAVKDLSFDVLAIKKKMDTAPVSMPKVEPVLPMPSLVSSISPLSPFPVPPEYRELINNTLNKQFGTEIEYTPTGFLFTIIVPEKYSMLTAKDKEMIKIDKRTKLIPNYEGSNGVRQWVELVYSSFSSEFKSLITADR